MNLKTKIILFFSAIVLILVIADKKVQEWRQVEDAKITAQYETKQKIENERYEFSLKLRNSCRKAISESIAPDQVLNWITAQSLETGKDFVDFSKTSTGTQMNLVADIGGKNLKVSCYLDDSTRVIRLARGNW